MPSILLVILAAFGTYRVARMVTVEEGAFGIFEWVRGKIDPAQNTWLGRGVNCFFCVSFWVALVFALLLAHHLFLTETEIVLAWFGLAGAATAIYSTLEPVSYD